MIARLLAGIGTATLLLASTSVSSEAGSRWYVEYDLERFLPDHPSAYFFDDDFEEEVVSPRRRQIGVYELDEFDADYYEPRIKTKSGPLVLKKTAPAKTVRSVKLVVKPELKKVAVLPTVKSKIGPIVKPTATVSCDRAAQIVSGYGFAGVKPKTCTGKIFVFSATRSGKSYDVFVSSGNGELTEVKRL